MNLRQCLSRWHTAPQARGLHDAVEHWVDAACAVAEAPPDTTSPGCGWFDSSHDLHAGLQVTEHLTPEPVAHELPLGWWLDWHMSAAGSAVPSAGACCR